MRLIIKPNDSNLDLLLEAEGYKRAWRTHSRKLRHAFREITGLDFQQRTITARVYQDHDGHAGWPHKPMHLPANYEPDQMKLILLVHELSHRLLGGNGLRTVSLGLLPESEVSPPNLQEYEHYHSYLFEYDVIERALGSEYTDICRSFEERNNIDGAHDRAWEWAMRMNYEQRQRAMKILAEHAVTREHWTDDDPTPRDPVEWFDHLRGYKSLQ